MLISNLLEINNVKRKYDNVFVFLPGPSSKNIKNKCIQEIYKHCDIVAVKRSFEITKKFTRFHIINENNLKKYQYKNWETKVLAVTTNSRKNKIYSKVDLYIPHKVDFSNFDTRLCCTLDIEKYKLHKTNSCPWGPGIMNDFIFYFLLDLGYKKIYINGWDYSDPKIKTKVYKHFYEFSKIKQLFERPFNNITNQKLRYTLGLMYNIAGSMPSDENNGVIKLSELFFDLLQKEGISCRLVESDNSHVSKKIPRISFNKFKEEVNIGNIE